MENLSIGVVGEEMDFVEPSLDSLGRKSGRYRQLAPLMKEVLSSRKVNEEKDSPLKKLVNSSSAINKKPKHSAALVRSNQSSVAGAIPSPRSQSNAVTAVRYGKHVYTHVYMLGGEPPMFQCKFCKRRFTSWSRVRIHLSCETGVSRFRCEVCSSMWHTKSEYERHLLTHKKPMVVECEKCNENFSCYLDYIEHNKLMHEDKNKKLDLDIEEEKAMPTKECGVAPKKKNVVVREHVAPPAKSVRRRLRIKQRSTGNGSRPFKCDYEGCTKDYMNKRHLKRHQLTHSVLPVFQCNFCDKRYRWKNNLTDHIRRDHPEQGEFMSTSPSPSTSPVTRSVSAELRQSLRPRAANSNPPYAKKKKPLKVKPENSKCPKVTDLPETTLPLLSADVNEKAEKESETKCEGQVGSLVEGSPQTKEPKEKPNPTLTVARPGDGSDDVLFTLVCSFPRDYVRHLMDIVSFEPNPERKNSST